METSEHCFAKINNFVCHFAQIFSTGLFSHTFMAMDSVRNMELRVTDTSCKNLFHNQLYLNKLVCHNTTIQVVQKSPLTANHFLVTPESCLCYMTFSVSNCRKTHQTWHKDNK